MDFLPPELMERIMLSMSPMDRVRVGTISRDLQRTLESTSTFKSVQLVIEGLSPLHVMEVFQNSTRDFRRLRLANVTLVTRDDVNHQFWSRIGPGLEELQFDGCDISPTVFYIILKYCQNLLYLDIIGCSTLMMSADIMTPPEEVPVATVQDAFLNLRHFSVKATRYVSDATFKYFMDMMPNLDSLSLADSLLLQFNLDVFERYHPEGVAFSPSILTFQHVNSLMLQLDGPFTSLDFSGTHITTSAIEILVQNYAKHLLELRLDQCENLAAPAFQKIGDFTNLRLLSFKQLAQMEEHHLVGILSKTAGLEHLDIAGCPRVAVHSCEAIGKLTKLRYLNLCGCRAIRAAHLSSLSTNTQLRHLNLSYTDVPDDYFRSWGKRKNLEVLLLAGCLRVNNSTVTDIGENFPKLEVLDLMFCEAVTDVKPLHKLVELRKLNLIALQFLSADSIAKGLGSPTLYRLEAGLMDAFNDTFLEHISRNHILMRHLNLCECFEITDAGLVPFLEKAGAYLRTLNLHKCTKLTDASLDAISKHCPAIFKLNVERCRMSDHALDRYREAHPYVEFDY